MKRTIDKPYYTYSVRSALLTSGIYVKCPKCSGHGIITADENAFYFKCTNCYDSQTIGRRIYGHKVENHCENCGRYYRVKLSDTSQNFSMLRVACPYCGSVMAGKVQKYSDNSRYWYAGGYIRNGCEPFFGYELWFLTEFKQKLIWALNREHLAYLIEYLSADLREKPISGAMRTEADQLPAFMKTAKNRDRIIKCLETMLQK